MGPAASDVNRLARSVQKPADLHRVPAEIRHLVPPGSENSEQNAPEMCSIYSKCLAIEVLKTGRW